MLAKDFKMYDKKEFYLVIACVNLCLLSLCLFFFKNSFLNIILSFELAFIASFLIIFLSFKSYEKNITSKSHDIKATLKEPLFELKKIKKNPIFVKFYVKNDDLRPNSKEKIKYMVWFFSISKILSYVFLVLLFLFLNKNGYLVVGAFLLGVANLPLSVLVLTVKRVR